jgi:hypothetical protein
VAVDRTDDRRDEEVAGSEVAVDGAAEAGHGHGLVPGDELGDLAGRPLAPPSPTAADVDGRRGGAAAQGVRLGSQRGEQQQLASLAHRPCTLAR